MKNYLLDTNILIDFIGEKKSAPFFLEILGPSTRLGTSIISITEFLVKASKAEEKIITDLIDANELTIYYLDDLNLARTTASLRKTHKLKLPDALILATAIESQSHLLTGDEDFLAKAKKILSATNPLV